MNIPGGLPGSGQVPGGLPGNRQVPGGLPGNGQVPGGNAPVPIAPGLNAVIGSCHRLYPSQKNPLQVTAVVKYWLGGPDPLDYISMYSNPGSPPDTGQHWHYVSCGLSDLHGDARVHPPASTPESPSGYGFELTFRLRRLGETTPPTWPANLLQSISKYVFETENKLVPGDHITWAKPLDGANSSLRHLLVSEDPQLEPFMTSLGKVSFLQLVGITDEELKCVQRWNGPGITKLLKTSTSCGGSLLVTDTNRSLSLFELEPSMRDMVDRGISVEGSNLCGMAACISWTDPGPKLTNSRDMDSDDNALSNWENLARQCDRLIESSQHNKIQFPREVALSCNLETAKYLPLCIQGRLRHGYHFTFKSILSESAVTFVVSAVAGTLVSPDKPFAAQGGQWLQVLIKDNFLEEFYSSVVDIENNVILPYTFQWPGQRLSLTVFQDGAEMLPENQNQIQSQHHF